MIIDLDSQPLQPCTVGRGTCLTIEMGYYDSSDIKAHILELGA